MVEVSDSEEEVTDAEEDKEEKPPGWWEDLWDWVIQDAMHIFVGVLMLLATILVLCLVVFCCRSICARKAESFPDVMRQSLLGGEDKLPESVLAQQDVASRWAAATKADMELRQASEGLSALSSKHQIVSTMGRRTDSQKMKMTTRHRPARRETVKPSNVPSTFLGKRSSDSTELTVRVFSLPIIIT